MIKAQLAQACWDALAEESLADISLSLLAARCDIDEQSALIHGGDMTELILFQLDYLDAEALLTSAADFAEDEQASIYEKILEGLMMRFEMLSSARSQFAKLHHAALRNPLLALHLSHQLSHSVGKLLHLAGDETKGAVKQARILGVMGVLLRVRQVWVEDDTTGLELTLKALDAELKKACEWAVSFRVLSAEDVAPSAS